MLHNETEFNKSPPAGFDGQFDWDYLRGAFPRGIMPMDIDASVEINGNFLWFETKKEGVPIPKGQMLALKHHVNNGHTVFIVWGKNPGEICKAMKLYGNTETTEESATKETIFGWAKSWAKWADKTPFQLPIGRGFVLKDDCQIPHLIDLIRAVRKDHGTITVSFKARQQIV